MENEARSEVKERFKTRAIVMKCSDSTYLSLLELIKGHPNCYIVFTKTSPLKLLVSEVEWNDEGTQLSQRT